jgi:nucleotide-binding universal stress UspA family protein
MKNILIPCDFSDASETAFDYGVEVASQTGSGIQLLHVNQVPLSNPEFGMAAYAMIDTEQESLDALKNLADKIRLTHPQISDVQYFCETGTPGEIITSFAAKHNPEYIVLGLTWHGSAIGESLFGSTALDVARACSCTAIVVPPEFRFRGVSRIAYACDYSRVPSNSALNRMMDISKQFNAELVLVHVVPTGHELHSEEIETDNYLERQLQNSPHRTVIIHENKIVQGLMSYIRNGEVDMIALEPASHSFLYRLFHPSTVKEMIFNSPVPVLALH